jgi:hypothetical protein
MAHMLILLRFVRLPDASIDPAGFSDDIAQLAKRGAGGTELLNYFYLPTVR